MPQGCSRPPATVDELERRLLGSDRVRRRPPPDARRSRQSVKATISDDSASRPDRRRIGSPPDAPVTRPLVEAGADALPARRADPGEAARRCSAQRLQERAEQAAHDLPADLAADAARGARDHGLDRASGAAARRCVRPPSRLRAACAAARRRRSARRASAAVRSARLPSAPRRRIRDRPPGRSGRRAGCGAIDRLALLGRRRPDARAGRADQRALDDARDALVLQGRDQRLADAELGDRLARRRTWGWRGRSRPPPAPPSGRAA